MSIKRNTQNIQSLKINGVELAQRLAVLSSRQDSLATALNSADGDYQTELADARVDAFGNTEASAGTSNRKAQEYLYSHFNGECAVLQSEIDLLSEAVITLTSRVNLLIEKVNEKGVNTNE